MRLVSVGCGTEGCVRLCRLSKTQMMKVGVLTDCYNSAAMYTRACVSLCVLRVNHRTWDLPLAHALFPTVAPVATTLKNTPAMKKAPKSSESMTGTPVSRLSCSSGP